MDRSRGFLVSSLLAAFALGFVPGAARAQTKIESATFGGLRARPIGPATMSGRISAVDAVPENPLTVFVGSAGGGVWRSRNGGISFEPVFDRYTQSIGAIRVDPSNPKTVWVGTGETWVRNTVSVGTGVYRSLDGGDTWDLMGLEHSERIARIAVSPEDGNVVYVCALGPLWNTGEERGVYKTTDGGKTWTRALYVDDRTGCADISMDPQDPRILYAGMWQVRRWPWTFTSGGPGSGLYRSTDGGTTWTRLTNGLPDGELGRIGVAAAPSRPNVVYAVVEAKESGLYRSDDLGETWQKVNTSGNIQGRPFYFGQVVVDPTDFNRVYKPGTNLTVSTDGGKTFSNPFIANAMGGGPHSDHHALWIDPRNPHALILGTDGGVYFSYDRGNTWRLSKAIPVSQFYVVSYDMDVPYNVYGGLQDNGTWMGPSRSPGGIEPGDWANLFGGDGFHAYVDTKDPDYVYVEYQGGNLNRYRKSTGETKGIRPYAAEGEPKLRFNWNTPLHVSATVPGTLYLGAQYLYRTRDRGDTWERISPDLTTNDPEKQKQAQSGGLTIDNSTAENHTTIYTISESPKDPRVIWAGTDDGNLQVTRDDGGTWTNVASRVPDLPHGTWVSHVEASRFDGATVYVTFDGHQLGDMATYAYRSRDYGATWQRLGAEGLEGYAHVIIEDLENQNLLFLGTEMGLFISIDGGATWARYETDFPKVAVRDLAIHPREQDLLIATHGRGIWILDDITPLRGLTVAALDSDLVILPTRPAVMTVGSGVQAFPGNDEFVGQNPPEAASIVYYQRRRHVFGDMRVEILDANGDVLTTLGAGKLRGMNRVDWPMRLPMPKMPAATSLAPVFQGPLVEEGTYKFRIVKGSKTYEGSVTLVPDPRADYTAEDRQLQQRTALALYGMLERLTYVVEATTDLRDQARRAADSTRGGTARNLRRLADSLEAFRTSLVATSEAGQLSGDEKLREHLGNLFGSVNGYAGKPTGSELERLDILRGQLDDAVARFGRMTGETRLAPLNRSLQSGGHAPLTVLSEDAWRSRSEPGGGGNTGRAR
jgi:photosystem II stability/assembly factor-like uncharacterized protein